MTEDYTLSPFDRRLVGRKNEYLIRHNRNHAQTAAEAILRREQPVWSVRHSDFRVGECFAPGFRPSDHAQFHGRGALRFNPFRNGAKQ